MSRNIKRMIVLAPVIVVVMILFVFLGGHVVKWLWNWLLPSLFGWPAVTFWQALGLLLLCRILFGGFGLNGSGRSRYRRRMEERCEAMPPEERERFRERLRQRWGLDPAPGEKAEG